jgi:hypothetical protein
MEDAVEFIVREILMIGRSGYWSVVLACSAMAMAAPSKLYASHILITDQEAQLPPQKAVITSDRRGITRGPRIELVSEGNPVHLPMHLKLKFQAFGGAQIDTDSVKVTYIKNPTVDLTPRLKEFVQPTGIDMPDVQLPPGDHLIRVDLKDTDGRLGIMSFVLKVEP